ncbi:PDZ domain-containing protein [Engelhardtia mirabilis]|uniref:Serine endoprotease n=1 Tax=Engelhardtia mirabilis TaxID=2528011 RepID=A0A518BNX7_9BACT|nr:serine endoprotease [Planctomycetes bacterium Pla133]QDV03005.1 serine endoprotease [Planctomycetes bacterium Pla86]
MLTLLTVSAALALQQTVPAPPPVFAAAPATAPVVVATPAAVAGQATAAEPAALARIRSLPLGPQAGASEASSPSPAAQVSVAPAPAKPAAVGQDERPFLGVVLGGDDGTVVVDEVVEGSAAEAGGLLAGDVLKMAGGIQVTSPENLLDAIAEAGVGGTLKLVVQRGGNAVLVESRLGTRDEPIFAEPTPPQPLAPTLAPIFGGRPFLGVSLGQAEGGALITETVDGAAAQGAGLLTGDLITRVDGSKIGSTAELIDAIGDRRVGDETRLEVQRDGDTLVFEVVLGARPMDSAAASAFDFQIPPPSPEHLEGGTRFLMGDGSGGWTEMSPEDWAEFNGDWTEEFEDWAEDIESDWAESMEFEDELEWSMDDFGAEWDGDEEWAEAFEDWAEQMGQWEDDDRQAFGGGMEAFGDEMEHFGEHLESRFETFGERLEDAFEDFEDEFGNSIEHFAQRMEVHAERMADHMAQRSGRMAEQLERRLEGSQGSGGLQAELERMARERDQAVARAAKLEAELSGVRGEVAELRAEVRALIGYLEELRSED